MLCSCPHVNLCPLEVINLPDWVLAGSWLCHAREGWRVAHPCCTLARLHPVSVPACRHGDRAAHPTSRLYPQAQRGGRPLPDRLEHTARPLASWPGLVKRHCGTNVRKVFFLRYSPTSNVLQEEQKVYVLGFKVFFMLQNSCVLFKVTHRSVRTKHNTDLGDTGLIVSSHMRMTTGNVLCTPAHTHT